MNHMRGFVAALAVAFAVGAGDATPVAQAPAVPARYDSGIAASPMIFQDGQAFKDMEGVVRAPNVWDNLIFRREIPTMIAVFINPGRTPEQPGPRTDQAPRTKDQGPRP